MLIGEMLICYFYSIGEDSHDSRGYSGRVSPGGGHHWQPLRLADPTKLQVVSKQGLDRWRGEPLDRRVDEVAQPREVQVPPGNGRAAAAATIFRVEKRRQLYQLDSYQGINISSCSRPQHAQSILGQDSMPVLS